ncbi:hypothetical protein T484DRAFT_1836116 [Baffinella frigidus]|nr:hypothetical protein T484DRAFT_1836116 [Cryptophyta sp. CCMP2293]
MAPSRRAPPRAVTAAPAPKISKAVDSFRSVKKNAGRGAAGKGKAAQVVESPVSVSKSSAVRESSPARTILGEVLPKGKRISGVLDLVPGTNDEGEAAAEEPAGLAEAPKPPSVRKRAPKSGLTRAEQRQIAAAIKASAAAEGKAADAPVDQAAEEEEEEAAGGEEGDGDAVMSISEAEHSPSSEDQHATAHTGGSSAAQPAAAPAACAQPVVLGAMAPPTAIAGLAGKWVGREEETARLVGLLGAPGVNPKS